MTNNAFLTAVNTTREAFAKSLPETEVDRVAAMTARAFRIASGETNHKWAMGGAITYRLLTLAFAKGYTVAVYNPGEGEYEDKALIAEAFEAVTARDETHIAIMDKNGACLGSVFLAPGNGCDTICDHTVNDKIGELVNLIEEEFPA